MKINLIIYFLFCNLVFAQVGVNTDNPTNTLDVNGTMRVRDISDNNTTPYLLSTNDNGIIQKVDKNLYTSSIEEKFITINAGEIGSITNSNEYLKSSVLISSSNSCSKQMIASFITYEDALAFINGVAIDKIAIPQIVSVAANESIYSPTWIIKFNTDQTCNTDNGGSSQFDFELRKSSQFVYEIKNIGDTTRSYDISFMKLSD